MLVNSIFSFSHIVFYSIKDNFPPFELHLINHPQALSIWTGQNFVTWYRINEIKELNLTICNLYLLLSDWLCSCLQYKSFENTVQKEEIARDEQFLLFPQCFLPV